LFGGCSARSQQIFGEAPSIVILAEAQRRAGTQIRLDVNLGPGSALQAVRDDKRFETGELESSGPSLANSNDARLEDPFWIGVLFRQRLA
jgi:hypothetical protein